MKPIKWSMLTGRLNNLIWPPNGLQTCLHFEGYVKKKKKQKKGWQVSTILRNNLTHSHISKFIILESIKFKFVRVISCQLKKSKKLISILEQGKSMRAAIIQSIQS